MGHTATGTRAGADRMDSTDHGSVRVITTLKYLLSLSILGSLWAYKVRTAVSEARVNRRSEEADCSQAEKASVKTQSLRQDQKHNRVSYFYISCGYFPLLNRSTPTPQFTLGAKRSRPRPFIILLHLCLPSMVYSQEQQPMEEDSPTIAVESKERDSPTIVIELRL